jgi:hypothetical protein
MLRRFSVQNCQTIVRAFARTTKGRSGKGSSSSKHSRANTDSHNSHGTQHRRLNKIHFSLCKRTLSPVRHVLECTLHRFAPTPALRGASSEYRPVWAMAIRKSSKCCQLFRAFRGRALFVRGMMHPYFSVGPSRQREALVWLPRRAGSSGISWRIHSLVKKTLHRYRAGFEPQRASSFMKRVKASQILGEAVRA